MSAWGGWRRNGTLGRGSSAVITSQPPSTTFGTTALEIDQLGSLGSFDDINQTAV